MTSLAESLVIAVQPFHGIPWWVVCALAAVYFVAFALRGALGFGAIAPAVVVTAWLIPPHHAVVLAVVSAAIPQVQMLPDGIRDADWDVTRPAIVSMSITVALGVWLFSKLHSDWLTLVLGVVISLLAIVDTTKGIDRVISRLNLRSRGLTFGFPALTGFIDGISGTGGVLILLFYLRHACRDHVSLRGTATLIGTLLLIWRLAVMTIGGLVTIQIFIESLILLPFVFCGLRAGRNHFRSLSPKHFYILFYIILLSSAVGLIGKGLVQIIKG